MAIQLTGSTGFLGNILYQTLKQIAEVDTLGRNYTIYLGDLSNEITSMDQYNDFVIHAAGKAHQTPKIKDQV